MFEEFVQQPCYICGSVSQTSPQLVRGGTREIKQTHLATPLSVNPHTLRVHMPKNTGALMSMLVYPALCLHLCISVLSVNGHQRERRSRRGKRKGKLGWMEIEGEIEGISSAASWHSQIRIMEPTFIACVFILKKRSAVTQQRLSRSGSDVQTTPEESPLTPGCCHGDLPLNKVDQMKRV